MNTLFVQYSGRRWLYSCQKHITKIFENSQNFTITDQSSLSQVLSGFGPLLSPMECLIVE